MSVLSECNVAMQQCFGFSKSLREEIANNARNAKYRKDAFERIANDQAEQACKDRTFREYDQPFGDYEMPIMQNMEAVGNCNMFMQMLQSTDRHEVEPLTPEQFRIFLNS